MSRDASSSDESEFGLDAVFNGPDAASPRAGQIRPHALLDAIESAREAQQLQALTGEDVQEVRIDHYRIDAPLGSGGFGVVYSAFDERLDRRVAIKLMRKQGSEKQRRRFVREAQAMARLDHQNLVSVFEIGEAQGCPYIVMELVRGQTLTDWLQQARTHAQIMEMFCAVGEGLAAAHERGIIHRDFKPHNVMVNREGRPQVMDFGLARQWRTLDSSTADRAGALRELMTTHGKVMGTPRYMAPEQFEGQDTDPRTDQFSFCVALWEALHGAPPFAGDSMFDLAFAVTTGALQVPAQHELPRHWQAALERGLSTDPAARWPSMRSLLDTLRGPSSAPQRVAGPSWGLVAVLLAIIATLLLALLLRS